MNMQDTNSTPIWRSDYPFGPRLSTSPEKVKRLSSLILHLPRENRELLRTVADIIYFTARREGTLFRSKEDILLVFSSNLDISPPLLRILCEDHDIWPEGPHEALWRLAYERYDVVVDGAMATKSSPESRNNRRYAIIDSTPSYEDQ
jgi:hypothetical protein